MELTTDIEFKSIVNKDPFPVFVTLLGSQGSNPAVYGEFYCAHFPCEVLAIAAVWHTEGTDPGTVQMQIEKLGPGISPDNGVLLLKTALDLKAQHDIVYFGDLTTIKSDLILDRGDRLGMRDIGTLTGLTQVNVTIWLKPLGQGHYRSI